MTLPKFIEQEALRGQPSDFEHSTGECRHQVIWTPKVQEE
jgi:hypothetical protein